jgi:hypothetical protein
MNFAHVLTILLLGTKRFNDLKVEDKNNHKFKLCD